MIEKILKELPNMMDDPTRLSKACIHLSAELFYHNSKMAEAELREKQAVQNLLYPVYEVAPEAIAEFIPVKKISVAEAEIRAVANTQNDYGKLKAQRDAIIEVINSIKARLRVLEGERNMSNGD